MHLNHPPAIPSKPSLWEKMSSIKPISGAKEVGDPCSKADFAHKWRRTGYPLFSWELPPSFLYYLRSRASYQLETQLKLSVQGFPGGPVVKSSSPCAGNKGSIPDPGRSHMLTGK